MMPSLIHNWLFDTAIALGGGVVVARIFNRAFDLDGRRMRRRRERAVAQARAWANAILAAEPEEWPPRPQPPGTKV